MIIGGRERGIGGGMYQVGWQTDMNKRPASMRVAWQTIEAAAILTALSDDCLAHVDRVATRKRKESEEN